MKHAERNGAYRFLLTVTAEADTPEEARELQEQAVARVAPLEGVRDIYAPPPVPVVGGART